MKASLYAYPMDLAVKPKVKPSPRSLISWPNLVTWHQPLPPTPPPPPVAVHQMLTKGVICISTVWLTWCWRQLSALCDFPHGRAKHSVHCVSQNTPHVWEQNKIVTEIKLLDFVVFDWGHMPEYYGGIYGSKPRCIINWIAPGIWTPQNSFIHCAPYIYMYF